MKKILRGRKLLTLLLAAVTIVVLTVCAHAAMIEEPEAPQTPEEFWDAVRDLELSLWDDPRAESESMNEPTGYESLLPQIEELVRSYANYEVGSLHYKDGILVWRSDGITCGYSPEYRNRMRQYELEQTDDPFEPKGINRSLLRNLGTGADIQATGFNNGSTPDGVVNVCTFVPYDGTEKNNFMGHEDLGKAIASYTGGTSTYYGGTNADIDTLAKALEECAVVVIGSHGTGSGAIGVTTNTGLTTDDYTDDHTIFFGIYYKSGSTEEDYRLWSIDGTVIANHMTKDAPNNLLISSSCEFMKNDAMCAPLRDKGVAVVYGYSESVISASADQFEHALIDALSRGMTVADAIVDMRETVGCAWDTYYRHLSYEEVQQSGVAFPIVVSAEDEYPGEGNVNFVQTVGSTWKLPLKADLAGKYVIGLNESVSLVLAETGDPVTAASVASGSLPAGMTLSASGNQVLLTGTPTAAGKSSFTLSFSTASEGNRNREEEILVADYDYANAHTSSQTESWTARDVSMWTITPLTSNTGDQHEIKCALGTSEQIDTVQIRESSLDDSLRIVLEGGEVFIRTFEDTTYAWGLGGYHVTPPGEYDVTLDCITKDGKVFRHKVGITVTARHTYSYDDDETYATKHLTLSYTATKGSECETNVRTGWLSNGQYVRWHDWFVKDFEVTGGSLPDGLYLTHGTVRPFGIYGTPTETGTFTVTCRVTGYYNIYEYKLTVTVEDAWTVSFETGGGTVWMTQSVKDGGKAHLPLSDPEKTGYTFTGWYADAGCTTEFDFSQTITEDTTVYAGWSPWTYDVIWKNDDGTVLEKDKNVTYGDTPSYDGATPEKPATAQYAYTFSGWTPEVTDAPDIEKDGDTFVYTAQYDSTVRSYTVTWVIDGAEETETYEYGKTPTHADPEKEATAQYTYTFKEWSPAIETVTGDATYTAVFDCTINTYTVLWLNEDGTELEKDEDVPYGETPIYDGSTPIKPATAQYTYTFKEWTPAIEIVTGDATYTAVFDSTVNHYSVTWVIDGWAQTEDYPYGDMPWHPEPSKSGALGMYYVFKGWSPTVVPVTGNAVYTAVFNAQINPLFPGIQKPSGVNTSVPDKEPTLPSFVSDPEPAVLPFTDVTPDSPYLEDIQYVYENDLMIGMSDTEFGENLPLTRGMIVTVLHRMEGKPEVTYSGVFTDVPAGEWYTDGVEWAASHGIVLGYGNGKYGPTDPVTREQLAAILFRYANWKGYDTSVGEDTNILSYDDAFTWGDWAVPALQWACGTGVLEDVPVGMLRPTDDATRGEIAHAIRIFCEEVAK